jgi:molybdate transport system permease protein
MRLLKRHPAWLIFSAMVIVGSFFYWPTWASKEKPAETITLFSAASTAGLMNELASRYEKETGILVQVNLASSGNLARQIQQGAQADIFLSANVKWMDSLQAKGLLKNESRRDLLSNRLVLVSPKDRPMTFDLDYDSDLPAIFTGPIATGDPGHVPAGAYAKEAMEHFEWFDALAGRMTNSSSAKAAMLLVEQGEVAMGIVYRSDAMASAKVNIVAEFPAKSHTPIVYPVALVSDAKPTAVTFLAWLGGSTDQDAISRFGFAATDTNDSLAAAPASNEIDSAGCLTAVMLSLKVAGVSVLLLAIPSVVIGWLLARKEFPGKRLLSAAVYIPLVVPPIATGYLLLMVLGVNGPVGQWLYEFFGIRLAFHWTGAAVASAVVAFPLMVRSVRLAITGIDVRLESAALTLGSNRIQTFLSITLPLAWPGIVAGAVLAFARSMGEFGATVTFAGNFAGQTRTLPLAAFGHMQTPGGEDAAMQLVAISIGLSVFSILAAEWLAGRMTSAPIRGAV